MWEYRKNKRFFAQSQRGLEQVVREELQELGAQDCKESYCGVHFRADPAMLYKINYCAATIIRVLAPLISFPCPSEEAIYKKGRSIPWETLFSIHQTFAITSNVSNSHIKHSKYAALKLKDAIVDSFRAKTKKRPDIDTKSPDIRLNLNIRENRAVISLDTSGNSLHKRGYRESSIVAPMQETLAAAIIRLSGWDGETPLLDPMCGSGTLLSEALLRYCNIPPGFRRDLLSYGFVHMPDFNLEVWKSVKSKADQGIRDCPAGLISGSDIQEQSVKAAKTNLGNIPGGESVTVICRDFHHIPAADKHTIITNPPYGVRVGEKAELFGVYKEIGDFLKQRCKETTAWILCGDKELTKHIGLKISRRFPLYNGPIETRLVKITIY